MSALRHVAQGFRNLWGAADEYDDSPDSFEDESQSQPKYRDSTATAPDSDSDHGASTPVEAQHRREPSRESQRESQRTERVTERYEKVAVPATTSYASAPPQNGGGTPGGTGARRLRPISMPLRASREKNIYTLKPKSLDESSLAADYLKTGCAVVINLEEVEQSTAIRIIDFMSGVCYGLEHQGHAMKLGDKIFLFTPGDFEISSDEVDYAENPDLIFKDVKPMAPAAPPEPALGAAERRSWER
ncbi:MAG TPA: cell division protein SepF [Abditibacterium sp.]|jgi:FtsZ-interacting cell division protein YlmF